MSIIWGADVHLKWLLIFHTDLNLGQSGPLTFFLLTEVPFNISNEREREYAFPLKKKKCKNKNKSHDKFLKLKYMHENHTPQQGK